MQSPAVTPVTCRPNWGNSTMNAAMTLTSLLVCLDDSAAQVLRRVLEELSIRVEACPDFARAAIRLAQERFDLVVVEGKSNSDITYLLRETKLSRLNDSTLAVAVVPSQDGIREIFSLGVNFILYKPVEYERALSSLRAARAVMYKEKRKSARAAIHAHATIGYANVEHEKATLIDLAQDGMSVQFGKKLPPTNKVYFQFQLPEQTASVRLSGQVVWQDWKGRAGVQFVDVPRASRRLLDDFLNANLPDESEQERLPDVSVEINDTAQPQPAWVGGETPGGETPSGETGRDERRAAKPYYTARPLLSEAPSRAESEADNRRNQQRYACRIGAQAYRTGIAVPHHCCLTDLSSGGCYLEVPLPFPMGTSVEIAVRTYELKLSLRGTVQASHPGFGMGVAFEMKTKSDRDEVKKLIAFVVATQPSE
jgi:PilZ domain